ncbi:hypothetical protein PGT21_001330 [Puccinia graminis f. sp. tritici]|uniref:Uncharacterized protein n=1 Tax=Puccinia graminis f. sp. tritici TaxID=56615 RepID=A0A5B0QA85_PUCGR|nr:hypothetical protein PGT21_000253 [Puccinia graminis f. sp. tritici]KAA1103664.1 hypothetical protein PGTUg99_001193 [Puccinia graminis f. sp. tritici]KAA1109873.1 hypothetical protein PGT21_001330 [Puccinia graminis f. sp. tritici]KAA1122618.1 hypothetical protein PGTUg99_003616 [Puccinia graminis f. sp. tritici]KAA1137376.1 hypothetical protein PGTUg99_021894 [Puccinia graminis f. sp. tritici]
MAVFDRAALFGLGSPLAQFLPPSSFSSSLIHSIHPTHSHSAHISEIDYFATIGSRASAHISFNYYSHLPLLSPTTLTSSSVPLNNNGA